MDRRSPAQSLEKAPQQQQDDDQESADAKGALSRQMPVIYAKAKPDLTLLLDQMVKNLVHQIDPARPRAQDSKCLQAQNLRV